MLAITNSLGRATPAPPLPAPAADWYAGRERATVPDASAGGAGRLANRRYVTAALLDALALDGGSVCCLDVAPTHDLLAITVRQTVHVVRLSDYRPVARLGHARSSLQERRQPQKPLSAVQIDPTGRFVATCGADSRVMVWSLRRGVCERVLDKHKGAVFAVQFDGPDRLWTAGEDGRVLQWEWRSQRVIGAATGLRHGAAVRALVVAHVPRGVLATDPFQDRPEFHVFAGCVDGATSVWDAETGELVDRFAASGAILSAARSPDRRLFAAGGTDGICRVWSLAGYRSRAAPLSAGAADQRVRVDEHSEWDDLAAESQYTLTELPVGEAPLEEDSHAELLFALRHEGPVGTVAFGARSDVLFTGSVDATLRVWSATRGTLLFQVNLPAPARAVIVPGAAARQRETLWRQQRAAEADAALSRPSAERVLCACANRVLVLDVTVHTKEADVPEAWRALDDDAAVAPRLRTLSSYRRNAHRLDGVPDVVVEEPIAQGVDEQVYSVEQLGALAAHGRLRPSFVSSLLRAHPTVDARAFRASVQRFGLEPADVLRLVVTQPYAVGDLLQVLSDPERAGVAVGALVGAESPSITTRALFSQLGLSPVPLDAPARLVPLDPSDVRPITPVRPATAIRASSPDSGSGRFAGGGLFVGGERFYSDERRYRDGPRGDALDNDASSENEPEWLPPGAGNAIAKETTRGTEAAAKAAAEMYAELTSRLSDAHRRREPRNRRTFQPAALDLAPTGNERYRYERHGNETQALRPAPTFRPALLELDADLTGAAWDARPADNRGIRYLAPEAFKKVQQLSNPRAPPQKTRPAPTNRSPKRAALELHDPERLRQLHQELGLVGVGTTGRAQAALAVARRGRPVRPPQIRRERPAAIPGLDIVFSPMASAAEPLQTISLARHAAELQQQREAILAAEIAAQPFPIHIRAAPIVAAPAAVAPSGPPLSSSGLGGGGLGGRRPGPDGRDGVLRSRLLADVMQIDPRRRLADQPFSHTAMGGLIMHSPAFAQPIVLRAAGRGGSMRAQMAVGSRIRVTGRTLRAADAHVAALVPRR